MGRIIREQQNENGQNGYIKAEKDHFVERVTSIPIIQDSVSTARKTFIGRFALSTLEYAIDHQPRYLANYYEQYVQPKVDAYGCRSLDIIQKKYPIVNQPTSEVLNIVGIRVRIDDTIHYPAHFVNKRLEKVVDHLEEKYLPQEEDKPNNEEESNQVKRAYHVLQRIVPTSREDLQNLVAQNAILQDLLDKLNFAQETLIKSISVYGTVAQEKLPPSVVARIQDTIAFVSKVTESIQQQLNQSSEWLKQSLQDTIQAIQQQITDIKKELSRTDISYTTKVKHITTHQ